MSHFELEVPSDPSFLKVIRTSVETLCRLAGMEEGEWCRVVLAVDEACANIIRHSYGGQKDKPIVCEGRIEDGSLVIVLRDFGRKVDPAEIRPRELSDIRPGGLGVHFMHEAMDTVNFEDCGSEGTCLTMCKRIRASGGNA